MGEREITPSADVYALGCVLYEMLLGEPPFTGPTAQAIVARVLTEEPAPFMAQRKTIPPDVEAAVQTALQKLPADRFATAAEFAAALANRGSADARTTDAPGARAGGGGARDRGSGTGARGRRWRWPPQPWSREGRPVSRGGAGGMRWLASPLRSRPSSRRRSSTPGSRPTGRRSSTAPRSKAIRRTCTSSGPTIRSPARSGRPTPTSSPSRRKATSRSSSGHGSSATACSRGRSPDAVGGRRAREIMAGVREADGPRRLGAGHHPRGRREGPPRVPAGPRPLRVIGLPLGPTGVATRGRRRPVRASVSLG